MYCSSRPESYLELVPSRDQDDLITKNRGRQRASKSQTNFTRSMAISMGLIMKSHIRGTPITRGIFTPLFFKMRTFLEADFS